MYTRFRTWNVRSLYRVGLLRRVASNLTKYNLDPGAVQQDTWKEGGSQPAFPIQNGLKQGDSLTQLFFNFGFKYAIRNVWD